MDVERDVVEYGTLPKFSNEAINLDESGVSGHD
jgi:hypothetical protein